jgi:hypothetical protein
MLLGIASIAFHRHPEVQRRHIFLLMYFIAIFCMENVWM